MNAFIRDATNGSEDSQFQINTHVAGSNVNRMQFLETETSFNEDSKDLDFRVESDGNTHMLFVDAGANSVGIGERTGSFTHPLEVQQADNAYIRIASGTTQENAGIILSNQDTQKWKIEKVGAAHDFFIQNAGGDVALKIDQARIVTMPAQPAFQARPASNQENIALNSAVTVVLGTEIFDQNADFSGSQFTAPVTGRYQLSFMLRLDNWDTAAVYYQAYINTSNRTYYVTFAAPLSGGGDDLAYFTMTTSVLADMDANDTVYLSLFQNGGTAQTDIHTESFFCGYLVA